jgi:hypothetical protein
LLAKYSVVCTAGAEIHIKFKGAAYNHIRVVDMGMEEGPHQSLSLCTWGFLARRPTKQLCIYRQPKSASFLNTRRDTHN